MGEERSDRQKVLVIDDEANMRHMLKALLGKLGYAVDVAADGLQGIESLGRRAYDFILCDIKMPEMDGMQFLTKAKPLMADATVIMMSAYGSIDTAVNAMKMGAYDYISKPFKADEVQLTLKKAEEREKLKRENRALKAHIRRIEAKTHTGGMVGKSKAMQDVLELVSKVADYDTTVLITGESGTGKELVARAIHAGGRRAGRQLVAVNCGGIPETLLESEFFGYRRGAFTGADRDKTGRFQEADKGTIFLDEIGELPPALQVKLLRVLQENEIRAVGDTKPRKVDVRVIAATQKRLLAEMEAGRFREDLYFRLNVLHIDIPPLRRRTEDIPDLVQHFIERFNRRFDKNVRAVSAGALSMLMAYPWPGNVRELENVMERAAVLTEGNHIRPENLPPTLSAPVEGRLEKELFSGFSVKRARVVLEKKMIAKALEETGGNRTQAARLLEISHPSLLSKMKRYDIS